MKHFFLILLGDLILILLLSLVYYSNLLDVKYIVEEGCDNIAINQVYTGFSRLFIASLLIILVKNILLFSLKNHSEKEISNVLDD